MYLYIAYIDGRTEVKEVRMFSDLSTAKSDFYYYEQTGDGWGKGTTIKKSDVLCIEVCSRLGTHDWEWKDEEVAEDEDFKRTFLQNLQNAEPREDLL